jgi:hypothetical protein
VIEEFQRELADERAAELRTHLERIGGAAPPKHLTVLCGTLRAHYDDGVDIEAKLEFKAVPKAPEPLAKWRTAVLWVACNIVAFATVFLLVAWLSSGNPVASLKEGAAVAMIAGMALYAGFLSRPK